MLAFYVRHFPTVEINNTSYRMPTASNVSGWAQATPKDFKLALKVPRRLTFTQPRPNTMGLMHAFFGLADSLGPKRAPVLMQLPPGMPLDLAFLRALLELLPDNHAETAIELRDASWHTDAVFELLKQNNVAMCISDSETLTTPLIQTSDFGYFRLRHEGYADSDVERWADDVRNTQGDAYVYFKHEGTGSGPRYASLLMRYLDLPAPEPAG
jgi:uncharacterized protein YecE (DUF72 family)